MVQKDKSWFIGGRSEALAILLLTSRDDVHVLLNRKAEDGVDVLVDVGNGAPPSGKLFAVQVKGTISSDKNQWLETVKPLFRISPQSIYMPACVFVVNVRDNTLQYAWLAKPVIQERIARLQFDPPDDFRVLNDEAVSEIVAEVKVWYELLPQQLVPKLS